MAAIRSSTARGAETCLRGAGVYANLRIACKKLLRRSALNELAAHLDPMRFIRVHRSCIANIDSIVELRAAYEPSSPTNFTLTLPVYGRVGRHRLTIPSTPNNGHRLLGPDGFRSDGAIAASHYLVGGLKLHPNSDDSEMLLQPIFLGLVQA